MTLFDDDIDAMIEDFGVSVVTDNHEGLGLFDVSDQVLNDLTMSTDYVLTVKHADFNTLAFGDEIEVDGENYEVKEVRKIDDGKLSKIYISKI